MLGRRTAFGLCLILTSTNLAAECDTRTAPWDYTNPTHRRDCLPTIEKHHLNEDVETLRGGMTASFPASDLYFILRHFPNHHPVLHNTFRLWRRHMVTGTTPPGAPIDQPPDYLFERATRFAPQDATVHMLYGIHLHRLGELESALVQYKMAEKLQPEAAETHYNMGLLYVAMEDYDPAARHARKAYALGYPLPGLRRKLVKAGAWKEDPQ